MPRPDWADQRITNPSILVNIAMQILTAKGRGETVLRAGDDEKPGRDGWIGLDWASVLIRPPTLGLPETVPIRLD